MIHPQRDAAILLCNDATGPHWQLGSLPPRVGAFALIGWTTSDADDGAVPTAVRSVLARALVRCGRITFPCSATSSPATSGWRAENSDYAGTFPLRAGRNGRADRKAFRGRREVHLLSTVREDAVSPLFDDPTYPWWHQGQFALLSRPAEAPPDFATIGGIPDVLIESEWADALRELSELGVEAILRPGVDGDVAGLLCTSPALRGEIEHSIMGAAADFGLAASILSDDAFANSLAAGR